jgi:hypothetical protein
MNICAYHTVVQRIIPKERVAKEAEQLLNESVAKLEKVLAKVKAFEDQLNRLKTQLENKLKRETKPKMKMKLCKNKITSATNLVSSLGMEERKN